MINLMQSIQIIDEKVDVKLNYEHYHKEEKGLIIMEHLLNPSVRNIQLSGIRTFFNTVSQYEDAISLTLGLPDFPTPDHIKSAAKKGVDANKTVYSHNAGYFELREAACHFLKEKYQLSYNPEDEVIVTSGASEAIDVTLRTILREGDEVILPAPVYPGYAPVITMCKATPVFVDTREHGFKLTKKLMEEHVTEKTRCILLPYPSNPTGCTLSKSDLQEMADYLSDKDLFIIADEIYSELTYDEKHTSIASFPGMKEKTVVINGLSKSHAMTGWRIGFIFAPSYLCKHLIKVHQYNVSCASTISQVAAIEALTNGMDDALPMREEYKKRLTYTFSRLQEMGLPTTKPDGAFYIFPNISRFGLSSLNFATKLLEEHRIAVVPGSAFSEYGEGYIRISYAASMPLLEKGMDKLETFIRSLES